MDAMDFQDKALILFGLAGLVLTIAGIYVVYRFFKKNQAEELAAGHSDKDSHLRP